MEAVKNAAKGATGQDSQFTAGHQVPIQHMDKGSQQKDMKGPSPADTELPTEDGGYQTYKAAKKLEGKKAIITGGDSGIGRAIAIMYAMEGADSLIAYLPQEQEDAENTKKKVEEYGGKCYLYAADLRHRENCQKVVDEAVSKMGGINILVNNAGFQNMTNSTDELSEDQWIKTFDINIHPCFFLAKYALPHMKAGDTVINCASINAYIGREDLLDYTSSKGAMISFTRGLSNLVVGKGIRVNAVCPGPVWTPLIPTTMKSYAQDTLHGTPMGRPGQPSEIATSFVFLASQDSSFMSGQSLHPNGGVVVNS